MYNTEKRSYFSLHLYICPRWPCLSQHYGLPEVPWKALAAVYMYAYGNTNIVGNLKLSIGYLKQPTDNIGNHSPSTITRYASKLLATACSFSFCELEQFRVICIFTIRRNASLVSSLFISKIEYFNIQKYCQADSPHRGNWPCGVLIWSYFWARRTPSLSFWL